MTCTIDLTEEQVKTLTPLFEEASKNSRLDRAGLIIGNPRRNNWNEHCFMDVVFVDQEYAEKISLLMREYLEIKKAANSK